VPGWRPYNQCGFQNEGNLVDAHEPPKRSDPAPSVRTLKIEADGDRWKGDIKPKIRGAGLSGREARQSRSRHLHCSRRHRIALPRFLDGERDEAALIGTARMPVLMWSGSDTTAHNRSLSS
jgi:hypothetical protein